MNSRKERKHPVTKTILSGTKARFKRVLTEDEQILKEYVIALLRKGKVKGGDLGQIARSLGLASLSEEDNATRGKRSRILKSLAVEGFAIQHGVRGGSYYTLGPKAEEVYQHIYEEEPFLDPFWKDAEPEYKHKEQKEPDVDYDKEVFLYRGKFIVTAALYRGRALAVEYLDEQTEQEADMLWEAIVNVAKNPTQSNSFKCFSTHEGRTTICEIKKFKKRIMLFRHGNKLVLTHGFKKDQNKTPREEIQRALDIRREYLHG